MVIGFAAFRFSQALYPFQGIWQDSYSYLAVSHNPFFSLGLWAGKRPPLTPLLLKIAGTPTEFAVTQTSIGVVAWTFLAVTVGSLASGWRRVPATAIVFAFACTLAVTEWDWSVLSESLALSALAFMFAFALRYIRDRARSNAVGFFIASIAFVLDRDEDIWTILLIGVAALLGAWVFSRRKANGIVRRTAAVGVLLIGLAVVTEVPVFTSQRDAQYILDVLVIRVFPYPDRVAWFSGHGMPDARLIDQLASLAPHTPGQAVYLSLDLQQPALTKLQRWITSDGATTYALWLAEDPGFVLTAPFVNPPLTFNNANGDISFYGGPERVDTDALDDLLFPGIWGELAILAVALVIATARGMWRRELWTIGVLGALGPVSMLIAWQGEAQEVTRHMVVGSVEARLGVLLLFVYALLGSQSENSSPSGVRGELPMVRTGRDRQAASNMPSPPET
jgi:hypothetical protein